MYKSNLKKKVEIENFKFGHALDLLHEKDLFGAKMAQKKRKRFFILYEKGLCKHDRSRISLELNFARRFDRVEKGKNPHQKLRK